jgi:hypothetical protein
MRLPSPAAPRKTPIHQNGGVAAPDPEPLLSGFLAVGPYAIYRVSVNVNERDEITASVAAHAELGPRYDDAVAEGLVERIGEEIDRRIDARLGGRTAPAPGGSAPGANSASARRSPAAYQPPVSPTPAMPAASPPPARRNSGLSGMVLGLGSMGLGVGATAVVVAHHVEGFASVIMVLLIWAAIAVINIAHSQRN